MDFVAAVYTLTARFPADERFGLVQQLRRAAVSIPSNIAEGQWRSTDSDFVRFLVMARGSVNEVRTQLLISLRLGFCGEKEGSTMLAQLDVIKRMLSGLVTAKSPSRHS